MDTIGCVTSKMSPRRHDEMDGSLRKDMSLFRCARVHMKVKWNISKYKHRIECISQNTNLYCTRMAYLVEDACMCNVPQRTIALRLGLPTEQNKQNSQVPHFVRLAFFLSTLSRLDDLRDLQSESLDTTWVSQRTKADRSRRPAIIQQL